MKIELHLFTNSTLSAPKTDIIFLTYSSFCDTSGRKYPVTVWCDTHPNYKMSKYYIEDLKKIFPIVNITESLSDGYIKAVNQTEADFCFMLEHDFVFIKDRIKHSLEEITAIMLRHDICHLRFNKRSNKVALWDKTLKEKKCFYSRDLEMSYCETPCLSNNPHLISVKKYRKLCLPLLKNESGSKGIEENISHKGLTGAIYGGLHYPSTVTHIDGRSSR